MKCRKKKALELRISAHASWRLKVFCWFACEPRFREIPDHLYNVQCVSADQVLLTVDDLNVDQIFWQQRSSLSTGQRIRKCQVSSSLVQSQLQGVNTLLTISIWSHFLALAILFVQRWWSKFMIFKFPCAKPAVFCWQYQYGAKNGGKIS